MLALGPESALEHTRALARERREIFDEEAIRADLARIREQRFATLLGDAHGCVAAPVFGPDGGCTASVAIVVAPQRMRRDLDRLVAVGRSAGYALTNALAEEEPSRMTATSSRSGSCPSTRAAATCASCSAARARTWRR